MKTCDPTIDGNGNPLSKIVGTECWFTAEPSLTQDMTSGVDVDASGISAISFTDSDGNAIDIRVTLNGSNHPFPVAANQALGLSISTVMISTDIDCVMFSMVR